MSMISDVNQFTFMWLLGILNISVTGSILLIAVLVANRLMKQSSAGFKFHLMTLVLSVLLILPFITVMIPGMPVKSFPISNNVVYGHMNLDKNNAAAIQNGPGSPVLQDSTMNNALTASTILFILWLSGIMTIGVRNTLGIIGMYRIIGSTSHLKNISLKPDFTVRVATRSGIRVPITCGLFHPLIILPENYPEWPDEQKQAILIHEAAHIHRHDNLIQLWVQFIAALYWFNPLVWIAILQMRLDREKACDDRVLLTGIKPSIYAGILLDAIRSHIPGQQYGPVSFHFNSKGEKRLKHILDLCVNHQIPQTKTKLIALLILVTLCLPLSRLQLFAAGEEKSVMSAPESRIGPIEVSVDNTNFATLTIMTADHRKTVLTGPAGEFPLGWPEQGTRHTINSLFGTRFHPIYKQEKFHAGIDIGSPLKTPIIATADGKVVKTDFWKNGYGRYLVIQHRNFSTLYSQLSEIKVKTGDPVKKGDPIAYSGRSGLATGPHLHYEIRFNGEPVDPVPFVTAGER